MEQTTLQSNEQPSSLDAMVMRSAIGRPAGTYSGRVEALSNTSLFHFAFQ